MKMTDAELADAIEEFRPADRSTRMACLIADRNLAMALELAELRAENARLRIDRDLYHQANCEAVQIANDLKARELTTSQDLGRTTAAEWAEGVNLTEDGYPKR